jgi:hypothetical protein
MGQGTSQAVIAPTTIFRCHLDDQVLECLVDTGTARQLTLAGAIAFVGGGLALPTEDGVGLDHMRDCFQSFLAQLLTDLGQGLALGVIEPDSPLDLVTQDAIFGHQIFIAEQEFLIHRP